MAFGDTGRANARRSDAWAEFVESAPGGVSARRFNWLT